jgi:ParB-like chromosome segregation protein Spo0J
VTKSTAKAAHPTNDVRVVGKVELLPLKTVRPNGWNPNRMTEFEKKSFSAALKRNGWLAAYALLVWRTDQRGRPQNLIIDGEHRWAIAQTLGYTKGPMVMMDGLTLEQAKELTVSLDNHRGQFDQTALRDVLKSLGTDTDLAFRLGFDDETFKALMSPTPVIPPGEFRDVSVNATTEYCCPSCGYEWRGAPAGAKKKKTGKK